MSLYLFSAALPLYLFRFRGYSLGQVGVLVGLASVVQIISALAAGPLVDRRGARLAMRLGAACYVVAALLFLTSAWLPAIVLARVLHGIGIALVLPAVFSVVPALVSQRFQGTALGTVDPTPFFVKYGNNSWAAIKGYLDAVADSAAAPVIEKYTGVLAAADVFTASTALWVLESIRLDLGVGIQVRA